MNYLLLCFLLCTTAASAQWQLQDTIPWRVEGKIRKDEDVSGALLLAPTQGLLVSDETRAAQRFSLNLQQHLLLPGDPVVLADGKGKELDLEAAALSTDGRSCYLTGSHGVSRKDGSAKPERMKVYRLPVAEGASLGQPQEASLLPVLQQVPELASSIGLEPAGNGMDIEALAERDGALFFGLRSPTQAGQAYVLEVAAEQLFASAEKALPRLHRLALGQGRGLRDMLWTGTHFLLISGPSADQQGDYQLHAWLGESLSSVCPLPHTEGKAEGLCLLSRGEEKLSLLVLYDGLPNAAPVQLNLKQAD